jgi:hypothetical protein
MSWGLVRRVTLHLLLSRKAELRLARRLHGRQLLLLLLSSLLA